MSLLIAAIALIYAVSKAHHIQTVNGQTISVYEDENEYTTRENALSLNDLNFKVAFRFQRAGSLKNLEDPRYLRTYIGLTGWD